MTTDWGGDVYNSKYIAQRLLAKIEESGLSYGELSARTGLSKSVIQRYAHGTVDKIPLSRLGLIAKALNTSAAQLIGWLDDNGNPLYEYHITQDEVDLIEAYREAEPVFQAEAIDMLQRHRKK